MTADSKKARPSCNSSGPTDQNPYQEEPAMKNATTDSMTDSTDAAKPQDGGNIGPSLLMLRLNHNLRLTEVARMANIGPDRLLRIEDNRITPTKSEVVRITEALVRLADAPKRPCPTVGCMNTNHWDDGETNGWHTAFDRATNQFHVTVDWMASDTRWEVYLEFGDQGEPIKPETVVEFNGVYLRAKAYADMLNRAGYNEVVR